VVTENDDFNALAAFELRQDLGHDHVYKLAAKGELLDSEPAYVKESILFGADVDYSELARRLEAGARIGRLPSDGGSGEITPLFVMTAAGELIVVTAGRRPETSPGDTRIGLTAAG
jgi:hypothetical protein